MRRRKWIPALLVGVTGGAGAGKSSLCALLARTDPGGVAVLDADAIGHEALAPGSATLTRVVETFGEGILDGSGRVDRRRLGDLVFRDRMARHRLEAIVHPWMLEEIRQRARRLQHRPGTHIVLLDAALLFHWGLEKWVDLTVAVVAPDDVRRQRLLAKALNPERVRALLTCQQPQEQLRQRADICITNAGTLKHLRSETERLLRRLLRLWRLRSEAL